MQFYPQKIRRRYPLPKSTEKCQTGYLVIGPPLEMGGERWGRLPAGAGAVRK